MAQPSGFNRSDRRRTRGTEPFEIAVLLLVLIGFIASVIVSGIAGDSGPDVSVGKVMVRPGDTPWELARVHPVAGQSTAETADLIVTLNGGSSRAFLAGRSIYVPIGDRPAMDLAMR